MDPKEPVVVYTTNNAGEAEVIRVGLEAHGIQSFVTGENQGGFVGVTQEITVVVPAEHAEEARRIVELTQPTAPDVPSEE